MTVAATLLTGACTWYEFGPALGILIIAFGISGGIAWAARRGQPCFTIEHECLVQHFGTQNKRYKWSEMRRPVRLSHKLFQHFLEVRREKGVPWLIAIDELNETERQRLLAIATEIICSRKPNEDPSPGTPTKPPQDVATTI